jgi:4-hydroxythreonine-4-phosphate dehydrogenase
MTLSNQPLLAITMGDPAGVGPEVIVGAWSNPQIHATTRPIVLGQPDILRRAVHLLKRNLDVIEINPSTPLTDVISKADVLPCVKACDDNVLDIPAGKLSAEAGEAAYRAVRLAADLAIEQKVAGIVTAPLSKAALHAAGHKYPGHTELLAEICGVKEFAMMLYLPPGEAVRSPFGLGVAHVTLHQSMRSIFDDLRTTAILSKCRLANSVMLQLGVEHPRIAVCAVNPHAGEDGLFGDEEQRIIAPAVAEARRAGIEASGPYPTDTLMMRARDGEFDAVVAMYHDQGHIALKLLGMHAAVNITLGLPIVRTSVAHGTAFDRAWHGTARSEGMVAAILTAAKLAAAKLCR